MSWGPRPEWSSKFTGQAASGVSYPGFWRQIGALSGRRPEGMRRPTLGSDSSRPVITIDGPAGSGKSTTAREVARRLGLIHLDSGALYRALTHAALSHGIPAETWAELSSDDWVAFGVGVEHHGDRLEVSRGGVPIDDGELRTPEVTRHVSVVAALPAVRACLLGLQRSAAGGGLVADGRDMGSVVFPDADVKVFLTADLEERARRRQLESGGASSPDDVTVAAAELQKRDFRDTHREHSPLTIPEGAHVLDTTGMTPDEQATAVVELVRALKGGADRGRGGASARSGQTP